MSSKTIVVADDDAAFREVLARRCGALGLRVLTAADGLDTLMMVIREVPDLLVLDINMPAGDGLGVAEKLLDDPKIPPVPVVFCTGRSDAATIERCKALGAYYVTKGTDVWPQLKSIVCRLLAIADAAPPAPRAEAAAGAAMSVPPAQVKPKVLFVDDDPDLRRAIQVRLGACGADVRTASSAMQALWMAMKDTPDVLITDCNMPEGSGEYLIGRLRAAPGLKGIPVIVLTGESVGNRRDFALERRLIGESGVNAFLTKPVDFDALLSALSRHIALDPEIWRTASRLRRAESASGGR